MKNVVSKVTKHDCLCYLLRLLCSIFYGIDADAKTIQYPFDHSRMIFISKIAFMSELRHQVINLIIYSNGRMDKFVFQ